jgi:hypothetical protein
MRKKGKGRKRRKGRGSWLLSSPARTGAGRGDALTKGNGRKRKEERVVFVVSVSSPRNETEEYNDGQRGGKVKDASADGTAPVAPPFRTKKNDSCPASAPATMVFWIAACAWRNMHGYVRPADTDTEAYSVQLVTFTEADSDQMVMLLKISKQTPETHNLENLKPRRTTPDQRFFFV